MNYSLRKILIVDDSPEDRFVFRRLLEKDSEHTYVFAEAENGRQAIELCRTEIFDCILLDFRLPDLNAAEILIEITREFGVNTFPVIVMSGSESAEDVVLSLRHGAHDFLIKGKADDADLSRAIENAIEKVNSSRKQKRDEIEACRLAAIVEYSEDAIISKDFSGKILSWNKGAECIFGYSAAESVGQNIAFLFPRERLAEEQEIISKIKSGESIPPFETVRRRKDDSLIEISLTVSPIKNENGEIIGVSKIARDITEQKRVTKELRDSEERLHSSEQHLRRVLNNLFSFVGILLPDGTLIEANRAPLEAAGVKPEEVFGKKVWETVWVNYLSSTQRQMREDCEKAANGEVVRHDLKLQISGGKLITTDFMIAPMRDDEGTITHLIASAVDITERKEIEERNQRLIRELEDIKFALDESSIVVIADEKGKITYVNEKFCEISGCEREEFLEQPRSVFNSTYYPKNSIRNIWTTIAKGEVWHGEIKNLAKHGRHYWVVATIVPFLDENGKPYQYVAICNDITERKRVEEALRESEERLNTVIDNLSEGLIVSDLDGNLILWNRASLTLHGFASETETQRPLAEFTEIFDLVTLDNRVLNFDEWVLPRIIRGEKLNNLELKICRKDIKWERIFSYGGAKVKGINGNEIAFLTVTDITERKRAEDAIKEAEKRFRATFEQAAVGIAHVALDGGWLFVNERLCEITGYTKAELRERTFQDITHPDDLDNDLTLMRRILAGEIDFYSMEKRYIQKSNSLVWINLTVSLVRDAEDAPKYFISVVEDITERKQAEEMIRLSEERYRQLFENNPFPMWVYDTETLKFLAVNEAAVEHYGFTQEDFLSLTIKDIRPEEDVSDLLENVSETTKKLNNAGIWKHRKKDHSIIHVEINSHELDFDGKQARLVLANDLTGRIKAEEALREKEVQLHAADRLLADIVHGMSEACFALDADWRFTFINDQGEALLRRSRAEILGKSFWDIYTTIIGTPVEKLYRRAMKNRLPVSFEAFSPAAERWLDIRLFPSGDGLAAFLLDIHERKMLEAERQKFVSLAENSVEFIAMFDLEGNPFFVNEAGWKMVGLESAEAVLKIKVTDLFFPEDREFIINDFLPKVHLLGHSEVEIRFRNFTTQQPVWMIYNVFVVKDENKEPIGFATVSRDISERRRAEEALRAEKNRLEKMAMASPSAIFSFRSSPDGKFSLPYSSPVIENIYGFKPEELAEDCSQIFARVHPEDSENANAAISKSAANMSVFHVTNRYLHPLKGEIWVEVSSAPTLEPDGSIVWHGVAGDVSERKQFEGQILESEKRYRLMFESNPLPMAVYELQTLRFLAVNEATVKHYGFSHSEFLKMTLKDVCPPEELSAFMATVERARNLDLTEPVIHKHLKKDGTVIVVELISHRLGFDGKPARLVLINDITERQIAEQLILQMNETLEQRVALRTDELNAANKELESFSYSVSHDLRAPLRAMDGFSLALLEDYDDNLDETGRNYLLRIRKASQQMAHLIDDMLLLSRVTRSEIVKNTVDLSQIVQSIADKLKEEQPRENIVFEIEENVCAEGDSRLLNIALENLLGNAFKFTSKTEQAIITFGQRQNGTGKEFYVKDNGAGFDMAYADKLFGVFQRLHAATEFEGTGIGLATVQRVIRKHGGRVRAEGKVGEGAIFYFTL